MSRRKTVQWPRRGDATVDIEFMSEYDRICFAVDDLRMSLHTSSGSNELRLAIQHFENGLLWLMQAEVNDELS
jgi:hypothetical protein